MVGWLVFWVRRYCSSPSFAEARLQTSSDHDRTVVPRRASSAAGGARAMEY